VVEAWSSCAVKPAAAGAKSDHALGHWFGGSYGSAAVLALQ